MSAIRIALLWLLIVNLGIALGAGLYESRIVIPEWLVDAGAGERHWNAEAARRHDTGVRFWVFVTTVPLTLLTLANLVAAFGAGTLRSWWLAAAGIALLERIMTLGYFVPTMVGLMKAGDTPGAVATASRWAALNDVRHLLVLAALLVALRTFSLFYQLRGTMHA